MQRVSVPFPEAQLRYRGKAKYGTGQKEPLTRRRSASNLEMDELWDLHFLTHLTNDNYFMIVKLILGINEL